MSPDCLETACRLPSSVDTNRRDSGRVTDVTPPTWWEGERNLRTAVWHEFGRSVMYQHSLAAACVCPRVCVGGCVHSAAPPLSLCCYCPVCVANRISLSAPQFFSCERKCSPLPYLHSNEKKNIHFIVNQMKEQVWAIYCPFIWFFDFALVDS